MNTDNDLTPVRDAMTGRVINSPPAHDLWIECRVSGSGHIAVVTEVDLEIIKNVPC